MNFSKYTPALAFLALSGIAIPATASVIGDNASIAAVSDFAGLTDSSNGVLGPAYQSAYDFSSPMTTTAPLAVDGSNFPAADPGSSDPVTSFGRGLPSPSGFAAVSTNAFGPATPEPGTILLAGLGIATLALFQRRRVAAKGLINR